MTTTTMTMTTTTTMTARSSTRPTLKMNGGIGKRPTPKMTDSGMRTSTMFPIGGPSRGANQSPRTTAVGSVGGTLMMKVRRRWRQKAKKPKHSSMDKRSKFAKMDLWSKGYRRVSRIFSIYHPLPSLPTMDKTKMVSPANSTSFRLLQIRPCKFQLF